MTNIYFWHVHVDVAVKCYAYFIFVNSITLKHVRLTPIVYLCTLQLQLTFNDTVAD